MERLSIMFLNSQTVCQRNASQNLNVWARDYFFLSKALSVFDFYCQGRWRAPKFTEVVIWRSELLEYILQ